MMTRFFREELSFCGRDNSKIIIGCQEKMLTIFCGPQPQYDGIDSCLTRNLESTILPARNMKLSLKYETTWSTTLVKKTLVSVGARLYR